MIRSTLLLGLLLAGCGPSFTDVQKEDTVEAYEKFIAENPSSGSITLAKLRLEELYAAKARELKTLEGYDAYLAKFPEGSDAKLRDDILSEREGLLFRWAEDTNTQEAWQKFLDEYPRGDKARMTEARGRLKLSEFRDTLVIGAVEMEPTNLAENPDGPLDGLLFTADVTNNTGRTINVLNMKIDFLDADGRAVATKRWPLVAPNGPGNLPIEEEFKVPVKPGETRTWKYMDMAPDAPTWSKQVRLSATSVLFADEVKTAPAQK